jgi:nicotinate-nucleotide adenylyltransferase
MDPTRRPAPAGTASAPRRIGVFGGTFDPPHIGHLVVAVNVAHALELDTVLLVVANVPWQKVGSRMISPAEDRFALVEAAVHGHPGLEASRLEIDRGGESYTADTLATLAEAEPGAELFCILGADAAAGLCSWERVAEIRNLATVVVVGRPGAAPPEPLPGWRWVSVECPHLEVSSTDLRARFADGRPLEFLLSPDVIDEVRRRRMYVPA